MAVAAAPVAGATFPGTNGLIGFGSDRDNPFVHEDIFAVNGGAPANLTNDPDFYDVDPAANPLGTRIAFISEQINAPNNRFIVEANWDGSARQTLFTLPQGSIVFGPAYSPDLDHMAFALDGTIQLGNLSDGSYGPVTPGFNPSFSSEGEQIFFTRPGGGIFRINADGTGEVELPIPGDPTNPSISPNGQLIAYEDFGANAIYVANIDGSGAQALAPMAQHPVFSPDNSKVAFTDYSGGVPVISTVPVVGGAPTPKTTAVPGSNGDQRPTWQPIPNAEVCDDGIDNDNDTLVDQADLADCPQVEPDETPPSVDTSKTKSKQPASRNVKLKVGCDSVDGSPCTVEGKATLTTKPGNKAKKRPAAVAKKKGKKRKKGKKKIGLGKRSKTVADGKTKTLKFKLSKKAQKAAKKALKSGGTAIVKIKLTVTSGSGATTKLTEKIRLKNPKKGKKS